MNTIRNGRSDSWRSRILLMVLLTTSIAIVATFGEFALGQLGWAFNGELGIPLSAIGTMASIMFAAGGVASIPMGWVVDRVHPRILAPIQVLLAAAAFAGFAVASTEVGLVVACAAVGAFMTLSGPLTNRMIAIYLPRRAYARVIGWKSIGPQAAAVLAGLSFGALSGVVPWRAIVWCWVGVMVALAIWIWLSLRRTAPFHPLATTDHNEPETLPAPARTDSIVWWIMVNSFFAMGAIASVGALLPLYAIEEMHLSVGVAGFSVSLVAAVSVASRFGWVAALAKHDGVNLLVLAGASAALSAALLALSPLVGPWLFWGALILIGGTALGSTPLGQILLLHNTSHRQVGMISAYAGVAGFAGLTVQPWIIATLADIIGFPASWLVMAASSVLASLTMLLFKCRRRAGQAD